MRISKRENQREACKCVDGEELQAAEEKGYQSEKSQQTAMQ